MRKRPDAEARRMSAPSRMAQAVFWLTIFAGGGYFPWQWGLAALLCAGAFVWQAAVTGTLRLPGGKTELACGGVMLCGGVVNLFTAVDPGGGREGLLRMLVFLLLLLALLQWDRERRETFLDGLPAAGAVMVLVSGAGYWIPSVRPLLFSGGRMAGPFQYANTFALFLLLGLARIQRQQGRRRWLAGGVLLAGIAASGSRWTMILLAGWLAWMAARRKLDRRWALLLTVCGLAVLIPAAAGGGWVFSRFIGENAFSTFWGRLLYWRDAASVLAERPLGAGYLGWFYLQRAVQTGVYNVRFVHNEWIQMALDYGIPAALAAAGLVVCRLRRGCLSPETAVLICLHSMADPDLQFYGMLLILALALSPAGECRAALSAPCGKRLAAAAAAAVSVFAGCRGAADLALQTGSPAAACRLAPYDTEAAVERMLARGSLAEAAADAYVILARNPFVSAAWQIAAENALDCGAYGRMAAAQREAVAAQKYDQAVYDDALYRLTAAMENGWPAELAAAEMAWLLEYMDGVLADTSPLGWKIADRPELSFPPETRMRIRVLQRAAEDVKEDG